MSWPNGGDGGGVCGGGGVGGVEVHRRRTKNLCVMTRKE